VVIPVVVWLGQALLSNQDNVVVHGTHIFDLFSIYIFIISNMNRIMQNLIMKIIPFTWPILEDHHWVIMVNTLVQE